MNKAFTLIELLVVIAIIAILAAILFPVFAQAKAAAKGTQALSNAKNLGTAILMYTNDFDDYFPPSTAWNTGNDAFYFGASPTDGLGFSPWCFLAAPYTKNYNILEDPLAPAQPHDANYPTIATDLGDPLFGYNMQGLAPFLPNADFSVFTQTPHSSTSLHSSAGFVMLASKWSIASCASAPYWVAAAAADGGPAYEISLTFFQAAPFTDNGPIINGVIGAPDCNDAPELCLDNWGESGGTAGDANFDSLFPAGQAGVIEGDNTGGASRRRSDLITTVLVDSHAKALKPGAAAVGTNFSDTTLRNNLKISDKSAYMWEDF